MPLTRPQVGDRAPSFTLPGPGGKPISLDELLARGPVVLYFYPRDETAGCTVEACAFRDSYDELRAAVAGAEVVGVSRDDERSHAAFAAHHQLPFPLLSDPDGKVHAAYGVGQILGLKDRVTFVIDREGTVRHTFDSKLRWHAHVDQALAAMRKLPPR
jgi:thioredoxin-dependent peroxiredoxin